MTDVLAVHGGTPLHGTIRVRGAKNLISKAMVAALLGETPSRLYDVPRIRDVEVVRGLLELPGVRVTDGAADGELVLDPANVEAANVDEINVHAGSSRIPIHARCSSCSACWSRSAPCFSCRWCAACRRWR